jgi:hypothetical protein
MFTTITARACAQTQADLFAPDPDDFELAAPAPAGKMLADDWIGHPGLMGTSRYGRWTHPGLPGVQVRHCGHPTALRPYYIEGLADDVEFANATFHSLNDAKASALAGRYIIGGRPCE